jgi:hypothetical protein
MKWLLWILVVAACEGGKGGGTFNLDGGSGIQCGGFAGAQCPADEWCDFPRDDCGATDGTGTCVRRPLQCGELADPVCGCDGEIHSNPCDANSAGVDLSALGSCPAEPGNFNCGARQCAIDTEFCQRIGSDIGGEPDSFSCNRLPAGCGLDPSCACLEGEACANGCEGDATTGLTAICFGG